MGISPTLNIPQARFLAMQHKFKAYVAGFGSGKTWVGCGGICKGMWEHPKINQGYFAPTYPQIRDIFYPTIEEVAFDWGLNVKINEGNKEVHFYEGRRYRGTTICRSMEKPGSIVGFKIGNAMVDELDVMAAAKAQQAWRKIIARMRYKVDGLRNGIDVTTTPEGFKFVYQQFVKAVREKPELAALYGLIQASTFDNAKNLPPDYIPSLLSSYPDELIQAYLRGKFTNLNSGTIYHTFNRKLNNCSDEIQNGDPLFIGMDFNVGKMAAIVHVKRNGMPRAVRELVKVYDTPAMIKRIQEEFWRYEDGRYVKSREIYIYPDASGDSRKSQNATAKTATQASGEQTSSTSVLGICVSNVSEAYTLALGWCAKYLGIKGESTSYTINQEFIAKVAESGMVTAIVNAWQSGALRDSDMIRALQKLDLIDPADSPDEVIDALRNQAPTLTGG
ncbi:terminase family protein [Enterobacter mori]|uniref:terminase large subunit domain-containing protein n=1 Tax=Enterobacter mori TaxID=539813 RepID=UPI0032AEC875